MTDETGPGRRWYDLDLWTLYVVVVLFGLAFLAGVCLGEAGLL